MLLLKANLVYSAKYVARKFSQIIFEFQIKIVKTLPSDNSIIFVQFFNVDNLCATIIVSLLPRLNIDSITEFFSLRI